MLGIFILLIIAMMLVVKFCKKSLKIVLSIIIIFATLYCIAISVDMNRVKSFREPIFAIVKQEDDSSMKTIIYQGLGYEVRMIKDVTEGKTIKVEMYMFNKCILGVIANTFVSTVNNEKNTEKIEWNEVTEDGVNEKLLFQNVDTQYLEKIATLLQSLSAEIAKKEQDDIDFYLSGGWYKYTLDSPQFNEVIDMGNDAIKPLYLIIYKSPNQGSYEYICTMALSKLVDFDNVTDSWSTSKEFLEKFNQKVISSER